MHRMKLSISPSITVFGGMHQIQNVNSETAIGAVLLNTDNDYKTQSYYAYFTVFAVVTCNFNK